MWHKLGFRTSMAHESISRCARQAAAFVSGCQPYDPELINKHDQPNPFTYSGTRAGFTDRPKQRSMRTHLFHTTSRSTTPKLMSLSLSPRPKTVFQRKPSPGRARRTPARGGEQRGESASRWVDERHARTNMRTKKMTRRGRSREEAGHRRRPYLAGEFRTMLLSSEERNFSCT